MRPMRHSDQHRNSYRLNCGILDDHRINNQNEATSRPAEITGTSVQEKTSFVSHLPIATKKYPKKSGVIYPQ